MKHTLILLTSLLLAPLACATAFAQLQDCPIQPVTEPRSVKSEFLPDRK